LLPADLAAGDLLGYGSAVSGNTVVVGARSADDNGSSSGAAYVFVRSGTTWTQQAKLVASNPGGQNSFGSTVCIDGDTIVIAAHHPLGTSVGEAYVFVRSGTAWTQEGRLLASDGMADDVFGSSVSVDGDTVVVGASKDNDLGGDSGSAYVFTRAGTTWTQQAKLLAGDGAGLDRFGAAVSIEVGTLVIGAWGDDDLGSGSGSAYVFVGAGTSWTQQAKLLPLDGGAGAIFGG